MAVRRRLVRRRAEELLAEHGVRAPYVPVEDIARRLGAEVRREPAEADLSGFLLRDPEHGRVVIGVNANHPETRRRFTVAHEIGHLLLHEGERIHVDRTGKLFMVKLRDGRASAGEDVDEREANLFAAEMLMPVSFLERDLSRVAAFDPEDETFIRTLAKSYRVSSQALTFRLANLGYINLD